jgi:XTP/dITP diphosphohydrolase
VYQCARQGHSWREGVADSLLKSRKVRRLVFASHDEPLVGRFRAILGPCGIEVMSLTEVGLPQPSGSNRGLSDSATAKAAVVAAITGIPAIGHARGFRIDPMLRYGGGGPQWSWPFPWPYASEELAAELEQADAALNASGYCGPDDRGAYFRSVLALVWPDLESLIFEGRFEGQFGVWGCSHGSADLVEDYFVPDGETVALASLTDAARQLSCDQEQAFEALRRALSD